MPDYSRFSAEDEYDRLIGEEKPVFSIHWDSGAPGAGADSEHVYRWGDGYIVLFSGGEDETVYPTLRDAIEESGMNLVTGATQEITSSQLRSEEIAALLQTDEEEESYRIVINGESWQAKGSGEFRRAR
jgi:hypothetical protein